MSSPVKQFWFVSAALIMIVLAFFRLDMRTDISDFLFTENNPDSAFLASQLQSDELQQQIILGLEHKQVKTDRVLDFIDELQGRLGEIQGVERVWSNPLDEEAIKQLLSVYSDYQVQLRSLDPEQDIKNLFTSDALDQKVQQILSLLIGPNPMQVKKLLQKDPMLLTFDWLQRIQARYQKGSSPQGFSTLFLKTTISGMNTDAQALIRQKIENTFIDLNARYKHKFDLELTGVPIFSVKIKNDISLDVQRVSALSMMAILLLFLLVFRSFKAMLLTAFLLLTSVSGAILVTQMFFGYVHGLTLALGATLMGVCIDYFIHAMVHGSANDRHNCFDLVGKIWPSLILGGVTTLIGYLALAASGFPGLQQISVFSASGIIIALLISRYFIPEMISAHRLRLQPKLSSNRLLRLLNNVRVKWLLIAFVFATFMIGVPGVKWRDNLEMLSPGLEQLKSQDQIIRSRISSVEPGRFVITEGANLETALQRNEELQAVLEALQAEGNIDQYFPVYPWIASKRLQSKNTQAWDAALDLNANQTWRVAIDQGGLSSEVFPDLQRSERTFINLKTIQNTSAWPLLSRQFIQQDERVLILTWLGGHNAENVSDAVRSLHGVRYFSQKDSINTMAQTYRQKASWMLMWGLLAILALLMWRFRSPSSAVKVLSPALLSIMCVLGGWGMSGHSMSMLHLVGLLLTAAICVDYGILFFENRGENRSLSFQAITASALTSAVSFACLGVAQNPALQALAWTVAPGIVVGFLLCPAILGPMYRKPSLILG